MHSSVTRDKSPSAPASIFAVSARCGGVEDSFLSRRLAELERALAKEIEGRGELEVWVSRQVDAKARIAVSSVSSAIESNLLSLHRQLVAETRERLAVVESDLGGLRHRITRLEGGTSYGHRELVSSSVAGSADGDRRALTRLEERISDLERAAHRPLERLSADTARRIQQLCIPYIEESMAKAHAMAERALADAGTGRDRVISLERWLSEVVTPELLRLSIKDAASEGTQMQGCNPTGPGPAAVRKQRREAMETVFDLIDIDGSGTLDRQEMMDLGKAHYGSKDMVWNEEQNNAMLEKLDANGDGVIDRGEFVQHYANALPEDMREFGQAARNFTEAAQKVRAFKRRLEKQFKDLELDEGTVPVYARGAGGGKAAGDHLNMGANDDDPLLF